MSAQNATRPPTPRWVGIFAAVCFLIALTALLAKYPSLKPGRSKSIPSEAVKSTASLVEPGPTSQPRTAGLTEKQRREIYKTAVRTRYHIEFAKEQRSKVKAKGLDVSSRDRQIRRLEQMHEDHLDFVARFHRMPRARLDEIVAEGDRSDWPSD